MSASTLSPTAYLLVFHGSRDPRPAQAAEYLAQFVRLQLESKPVGLTVAKSARPKGYVSPSSYFERLPMPLTSSSPIKANDPGDWPYSAYLPLVGTACLEAGALSLHEQIIEFGHRVSAAGVRSIRIVPLFLLKGIHVSEDIPAEVQLAQRALPTLTLRLCAHLGSHVGLEGLVRTKLQSTTADDWLLLAHGSRRIESNGAIQSLAESLGGTTAYWAVSPSLETQVIQLIQQGVQRLAILPYFLFTGPTTDAVTRRTEDLAERFPSISFHLLPPLGPSPELAHLVVDLALGWTPLRQNQGAISMKRVAFRHQIQRSSMGVLKR
ncbi:MAG: sirohydrochlorin chelatase [Leptolyngbyaceae cyanobacterium SM2_5_2]|nr:sirohydrochlorin chelatase [Leptolyngbyaceae cyanobacterium SM2_5_2]